MTLARLAFLLISFSAVITSPGSAKSPAGTPASALVGLWEAKKRFGPDVSGDLTIVRRNGEWRAEIAGRVVPAQVAAGTVSFTLPGGEGSFRGIMTDGGKNIRGHWRQPRTIASGLAYLTPVELVASSSGLWRGDVRPLDDSFSLYLRITANPDGTLGVFMRNPERNIGNAANLRHVERKGDTITLFGRPDDAQQDIPIATGRYNEGDQTLSIDDIGRGGTYEFQRADALSDFYPRPALAVPYGYRPPLPRADGWPVGTLASVGISQPGIERFVRMVIDQPIDSLHSPEIHGVLIARHGKLVLEEYFHGIDGTKPHDTRSAAKSATSVLVGAAIRDGAKLSVTTPVYRTMLGNAATAIGDPRKNAMTLEHLLTMSSGYHCDDGDGNAPGSEDRMQSQRAQPDWYRYTLDLPMAAAPGAATVYCSVNPNLAGGMLAKATGERLEDSFDRLIACPLQFGSYALDLQPTGEPYMGGGAQFLPRDFMKLGQMMLDGGTWRGRRIVDADWVARSTSPIKQMRGLHYGYLWWGIDLPYRGTTLPAFYAAGNGGQLVMVVPKLDLVIAIYAGNYGDKVMYETQEAYTPKYILPAVH